MAANDLMLFYQSEEQNREKMANTACTGRWGFCAIYKHFPRFEFSLLPSRVHVRPSASNASRWAAENESQKSDEVF